MGMGSVNGAICVVAEMRIGIRKQARRTQMAGPLGEMFDHGKSSITHTIP